MSFAFLVLAFLAAWDVRVDAHSWVEQLMVIGPDGTFVGEPGYPRANVLRGSPDFGDPVMVNLLPANGGTAITDAEPMCKESQATPNQSEGSPRLKAAPGSLVSLRYQENGHVTLPDAQLGKAKNRGTVYVYGTKEPRPTDTFLDIHNVWTADGSGGDKRGRLLVAQNFDDGQCYQVNGGPISTERQSEFPHEPTPLMGGDLWCQNNIKLPEEATAGSAYTLYWVWDWATEADVDPGLPKGKAETYTTCMDVDVTDEINASVKIKSKKAQKNAGDVGNRAIPSYLDELQNPSQAAPLVASSSQAPSSSQSAPVAVSSPAPAPAPTSAEPSSLLAPVSSNSAEVSPSLGTVSPSNPAELSSSLVLVTSTVTELPPTLVPVSSSAVAEPSALLAPVPSSAVAEPSPSLAPVSSSTAAEPSSSLVAISTSTLAVQESASQSESTLRGSSLQPAPTEVQSPAASPDDAFPLDCKCERGDGSRVAKREVPEPVVTATVTVTATVYPRGTCIPSAATTLVTRVA